jgi:predicted MFS family arabinose efflux permease
LIGGLLVEHASWRWVFYVNLPLGLLALSALRLRFPAVAVEAPRHGLDLLGAGLLAAATAGVMLVCIWGGQRYAWGSAAVVSLFAGTALLSLLVVLRERRAADPIVPIALLRTRPVAVASAALFLTTAALFAVNVFVPLFLQTTTGATPIDAGLLLVPMMIGITVSTTLAGRVIARTGRYKIFPIAGLALMTVALVLLAVVAKHPSRTTIGIGIAIFGLGFGVVGQVLITAVQNSVEGRQLGVAMAATSFFRALGGAIGAAVFGAVFAARTSMVSTGGAVTRVGAVAQADIVHGVQAVFLLAAPVAAVALCIVLLLKEVPLRGPQQAPRRTNATAQPRPSRS